MTEQRPKGASISSWGGSPTSFFNSKYLFYYMSMNLYAASTIHTTCMSNEMQTCIHTHSQRLCKAFACMYMSTHTFNVHTWPHTHRHTLCIHTMQSTYIHTFQLYAECKSPAVPSDTRIACPSYCVCMYNYASPSYCIIVRFVQCIIFIWMHTTLL